MIQKSAITPVVSVVALTVQLVFHKQIPADIQDQASTIILNAVLLYSAIKGIFTNHDQNTQQKG